MNKELAILDQPNLTPAQYAKALDIPLIGITNLGGKPYVNSTGLLYKARNMGMAGISVEIIKSATNEDMSAIAKATVKMKDNAEFEDMGMASRESVKMTTLHNADFITMMAVTRAKNRALRSATGVGLVSSEEMKEADDQYVVTTNLDAPAEAPAIEAPKKTTVKDVEVAVEKAEEAGMSTIIGDQIKDVLPDAPATEKLSPIRLKKIKTLLEETGKEEAKMLSYFKVESVEDLSIPDYRKVLAILEAAKKEKAAAAVGAEVFAETVPVVETPANPEPTPAPVGCEVHNLPLINNECPLCQKA